MSHVIFEKYPQLKRLTGFIPEDVIIRNVEPHYEAFEADLARARESIPTVLLKKIFSVELESEQITLERFLGHFGNLTIEEICKLCLITKHVAPKRVLEIGTYNGMSTLNIALNAPKDAIIYTLDLSEEDSSQLPTTELDTYVAKHAKENFNTTTGSYFADRSDLNIKQIWGDSATYDYAEIDGPVDLVFIDAAHDYDHKRIDTEKALALLSDTGVIIWHNYNDVFCPDVTKYLADLSADRKIFHLRDTLLAVHYAGYCEA